MPDDERDYDEYREHEDLDRMYDDDAYPEEEDEDDE
jgi:hypothetical protein